MSAVIYEKVVVPPRYVEAHSRFWERLQQPGCWLTGAERVAVAREVRKAWDCKLCSDRRQALSPAHVSGDHDRDSELPEPMVDVVHRVTTDPGRLTRKWFEGIRAAGVTHEQYVEILGTLVAAFSIDEFCRGIGVAPHKLPRPAEGAASNYRPASAVLADAWVPMIPEREAVGNEADLWNPRMTANVIRAMSLVPDEVRTLKDLSDVHYVPMETFLQLDSKPHGTLTRMQMELLAGRVSAQNGCFY